MGWIKSTLLGLSANSQKPFSSITQLSVWHAIITLKFTVIIINQSMSWGTLNYWRKKQNQHQTILLSHKFLPTIIYSPAAAAAATKSLQLCLTLCDPRDGSPPGSPVPGILQAKTRVGCHFLLQCMKVKIESEVAQLYPTLCNPMDCSLPGSSIHGIFQARVPEYCF